MALIEDFQPLSLRGALTAIEKLESLGVRGILWQLARDGQAGFRMVTDSRPLPATQDARGSPDPDNVRLGHRLCHRRDYTWRQKINVLLGKRMSLEEIAEKLNAEKVPTIHGTKRWTAASIRKAFVS
jgi:hypothetical protein